METFDYIVIGAGSAGCALSARLAQAGKQVRVQSAMAVEQILTAIRDEGYQAEVA